MTTSLPIVRASSMTLASKCPAAIAGEGTQIDSFDPTSTTGSDVHRAITLMLQGKPLPELTAETEKLATLGKDWVTNWLRPKYPRHLWRNEWALEAGNFRGTLDLGGRVNCAGDAEPGIVVDFKNTYRDDDHSAQLITYAYLLLESDPYMQSVTVYVPMLRLGKADQALELPRDWVMLWIREFTVNTLRHPEIFRPGEWCSRCKRKATCPALRDLNRQTVEVFADRGFEGMLTRDTLPDIRMRVKLVKEAIKCFEDFQTETILEQGPISLGEGKLLKAFEIKKDIIGLSRALPLLQEIFGSDADIEKFVTVGKTAMLEAIGSKAPKGMKGKAQAAFMNKLEAAGAVSHKTETRIVESKD